MPNKDTLEWYAYVHASTQTIHVKRFFSPGDIAECKASPFLAKVTGPFEAKTKELAAEIAKARLR